MALPVTYEGVATPISGGVKIPFVVNKKLSYISNDSSSFDMKVNFDGTTMENRTFTLKAGESLSDVEMSCTTLSVESLVGNTEFRALGV